KEVRLVQLETTNPHTYAAGLLGIVMHNRVPALAPGQTHNLAVHATGAQVQFTLPPVERDHIFHGFFRAGTTVLEGLHHITGPHAIMQGVVIAMPQHAVITTNAAGAHISKIVELRLIPWPSTSGDAPFAARVEVFDPVTNGSLAQKTNSTFFPVNWTQNQV